MCGPGPNLSGIQNYVKKDMRFKTPTLRSDLGDYNNVYIFVKGTIDLSAVTAPNVNDKFEKDICLKIPVHVLHKYKKLTTHLQTMEKILI